MSGSRRWGEDARAAVRTNAAAAATGAGSGAAYGRTTGVRANRNVEADDEDVGHGLRLLRSHATGAGADLGSEVARTAMEIRGHQLSVPVSGIPAEVVDALDRAFDDDRPLVDALSIANSLLDDLPSPHPNLSSRGRAATRT